jgi:hypothetical protein
VANEPEGELTTLCHMTYYPSCVMPVREHLENSAQLNPHGCGWGILAHNPFADTATLITGKTLHPRRAIDGFMQLREAYPAGPAVFHSRYSTGGSLCLDAVHPVEPGAPGLAVFHNGFLFAPEPGEVSDTNVLARDILPRYDLDDPDEYRLLERRLGRNKVIVLADHTTSLNWQVYILNQDLGLWLPDGSWHSNGDYTGVSHHVPGRCGACYSPSETVVCAACLSRAPRRRRLLTEPVTFREGDLSNEMVTDVLRRGGDSTGTFGRMMSRMPEEDQRKATRRIQTMTHKYHQGENQS